MATYSCDCGRGADVLLREVGDDGQSVPFGKAWAVCAAHAGRVLPQFVGMTIRVHPVSKTWAEHVERRHRENAAAAAAAAAEQEDQHR